MIEKILNIQTADGTMWTFCCHPERERTPVVLMYMDAYGIREELQDMARRLATSGYFVLLPNLYYRTGELELGPIPYPDEQERIDRLTNCVQSLTIESVMADTAAMLEQVQDDPSADTTRVGTVGYCMSGRFAIAAAARDAASVRAAASIYGTWLVSDHPESPHRAASGCNAELYFACAEIDHWTPLPIVDELRSSLDLGKANAEVEVYRGVEHAFAFPSRRTYNRDADNRHWERLIGLFRRNL